MKAFDTKNKLFVTILSVSGGWTTVMSGSGAQYKLRNSQIAADHNHKAAAAAESLKKLEADPTATVEDYDTPKTTRKILSAEISLDNYTKVKSSSGRSSLDCGDKVARQLRGKTIDEVYTIAAEVLAVPEGELRARYKHLNVGMQRMNLANRDRK